MPPIIPSRRDFEAGVPEQWTQDFGVTIEGLITGETPKQFTEDMPVALSQTLEAYTVVGLNGAGNVVPAEFGVTQAIGILLYPVTTGGLGDLPVGRVLRAGCVNPDALVWPASYNTAERRLEAFRGAPTPTQIVVRGLASFTPVLP